MTKTPKFLQIRSGETVARRPHLDVDDAKGDATALDVVRKKPLYKTQLIKKLRRRISEFEELRAFAEKKADKGLSKSKLEEILKN